MVRRITIDIRERNGSSLASKVLEILLVVTKTVEIRGVFVHASESTNEKRREHDPAEPDRHHTCLGPARGTTPAETRNHWKRDIMERSRGDYAPSGPGYRVRLSYLPARVP